MNLAGYEVSDQIPLPPAHGYGIGIVGCGGIVNYAHLPAYKANGLNVVACFDANPEAAAETAAGKHLLCQKPLSNVYPEAVQIVESAHAAGVKLAVNQQMRWDAGIRVARQLLDQ